MTGSRSSGATSAVLSVAEPEAVPPSAVRGAPHCGGQRFESQFLGRSRSAMASSKRA